MFDRVLVGDPQEQGDDEVVGKERTTAVGHERQSESGEGQDAQHAGHDDERLKSNQRRESRGCEARVVRMRSLGNAKSLADEEREEAEEEDDSDEAQLLTDGRESCPT